MRERVARARTTTRQPRIHPLATPGLSTNTGALAAAAWLADRGITPEHERWFVEVDLRGAGTLAEGTRFLLEVYAGEWGLQLHHRERTSWIRVTDVAFVHGRDDWNLLGARPRLREIGLFIRDLERRFGIELDRQSAAIRTNIPKADEAVRVWVAAL